MNEKSTLFLFCACKIQLTIRDNIYINIEVLFIHWLKVTLLTLPVGEHGTRVAELLRRIYI